MKFQDMVVGDWYEDDAGRLGQWTGDYRMNRLALPRVEVPKLRRRDGSTFEAIVTILQPAGGGRDARAALHTALGNLLDNVIFVAELGRVARELGDAALADLVSQRLREIVDG